jgi:hypothetical protein
MNRGFGHGSLSRLPVFNCQLAIENRKFSMSESPNEIQHYAEHDAQQDGGGQRKIKRRVFAVINNVTRETSDRKIRAAQQHQRDSHNYDDYAHKDQQFS